MALSTAESSDNTWAGEEDFVVVEATESGSAECSSSGSEAAPRPQSLPLAAHPDAAALQLRVRVTHDTPHHTPCCTFYNHLVISWSKAFFAHSSIIIII